MKIRNFTNGNGRDIPNQFIIENENTWTMFQSYKSKIAMISCFVAKAQSKPVAERMPHEKIMLDINYWDYSNTTGKYRNIFLNESKRETEKKIKSGEYILVDLNE